MWKNVHPVSGTGIRTHDFLNVSLLPKPLDQGNFEPNLCVNRSRLKKLFHNYLLPDDLIIG